MAINRAAGKLAELTGRLVNLRVPKVDLLEMEDRMRQVVESGMAQLLSPHPLFYG